MATYSFQSLLVVRPMASPLNFQGSRKHLDTKAKYSLQPLPVVRPLTTSFISRPQWSNGYCCRQTRMLTITSSSTSTDSSTLPSRRTSPWLMLPSLHCEDMIDYKFYSLAEKRVIAINKEKKASDPGPDTVCIGSSHGWVASINRRDRSFFMFNPITGSNIKLPSIRTLPIYQEDENFYPIWKFFLSSAYPDDAENCRALIVYQPLASRRKRSVARLAFCSPAACETDNASASWTLLDSPLGGYEDVVYSPKNQKLFCMDKHISMEAWDLTNPSSPTRHAIDELVLDRENRRVKSQDSVRSLIKEEEHLKRYFGYHDKSYLVLDPSSSPLGRHFFLIDRFIVHDSGEGFTIVPRPLEEVGDGYRVDDGSTMVYAPEVKQDSVLPYKTMSFDVYKIDTGEKVASYMDSLDDRAFFVGLNHSFVLSAKDFPELKPNSVYFTDDRTPMLYESSPFGGHDVGIYNYKDKTVEECYYPIDVEKISKVEPSPVWLTPNWYPSGHSTIPSPRRLNGSDEGQQHY